MDNHIKQAPVQGMTGLWGGTQGALTSGVADSKTYIDDVFNTVVRKSSGSTYANSSGLDLSGEGGMVWTKSRSNDFSNIIHDSERGASYSLTTDNNNGSKAGWAGANTFNTTGYSIAGGDSTNNASGYTYVDWAFRKSSGFFDIVTYTGNGSESRTIAHNLGSVPGFVMFKRTDDDTGHWITWHRDYEYQTTETVPYLRLNGSYGFNSLGSYGNSLTPTATHLRIPRHSNSGNTPDSVNVNGGSYIAYVFAGGRSPAATARSVEFVGHSAVCSLTLAASTDLDMGTGDFTIEFWYKGGDYSTSYRQAIIGSNITWQSGFTQIQVNHPSHINHIVLWDYDIDSSNPVLKSTSTFPSNGTWRHVALTRSSGELRMFVNGNLENSATQTGSLDFSDGNGTIMGYYKDDIGLVGDISNLRVVKGTAVYTSSFRPPIEPLTNITNTKLLCCNVSHVINYTVSPGTITANGTTNNNKPQPTTDSPFDDPDAHIFGDDEDQPLIKCGSYKGKSSHSTICAVDIGFEPQWVLVKASNTTKDWVVLDCMRRWTCFQSGSNVDFLRPNLPNQSGYGTMGRLTSTGFVWQSSSFVNGNDSYFTYIAVKRSDGYVGKPATTGASVFSMDENSDNSATIPCFDSSCVVDFAFAKRPDYSGDFYTSARLMETKYLSTNDTSGDASGSGDFFDSNDGWGKSYSTDYMSWMWRRHAGFDVVGYLGNGQNKNAGGHQISHSLGKTPEMLWVKKWDTSDWQVWHKGLNGGSSSGEYFAELNNTNAQSGSSSSEIWADSTPTATHFILGDNSYVNTNNSEYIAFLFASTAVSKVGYYTGTGSNRSISFGFQPRFMLTKRVESAGYGWYILDTTRGWASGNDPFLELNSDSDEGSADFGTPTSTGIDIVGGAGHLNENNAQYIYYAHA